ncbi:mechanosensitive ion channel family protein [Crocosphaera sp.]|uniref:mechanosensitive ion channel family protein n=1 Tax=Crocosphaera sp. TaxID=2729996 RepID=UPI003F25BB8C|nr:mechanosensitive ion channel family protein [Crocosphaera sp.]
MAQIKAVNFVEIGKHNNLLHQYFLAQEQQEKEEYSPDESVENAPPAPVTLDGKTLFEIKTNIEGFANQERAEVAIKRIRKVAEDRSIDINNLDIRIIDGVYIIHVDNNSLFPVINTDAEVNNKSLDQLAEEYAEIIKNAIIEYREKRTLSYFGTRGLLSLLSTVLVILIFRFLNWLIPVASRRILEGRSFLFRTLRIQNWTLLSIYQEKQCAILALKIIRWIIIFVILYFYIPLVLSLFPQTERLGNSLLSSFFGALGKTWSGFIDYLPNLFLIIITLIITHYLIRLCEPFFKAIQEERITLSGFYPDWAQPTYKLTVILIIGLAAAIIFPYLPGFNSPAFQGISILAGALVTFGGASTIANLIGGFVVIYTRAFQIGDRIKISEYRGVVIEKTVLSTRICNGNNEIITIPNSILVASTIINYSATIRDLEEPLVIETTITLGYDVPWRLVHETLINCALETTDVLQTPEPYVWQTSLDDFYISYELRVYTNKTRSVAIGNIYNELHQKIQDKCAEVGIEIMSPHYAAVRDGHQNTIPENYLPKDYKAPGFRLHPLESFFKQNVEKDS